MRENIIVNTVAEAFRVVFDLVRDDCCCSCITKNGDTAMYYSRNLDERR